MVSWTSVALVVVALAGAPSPVDACEDLSTPEAVSACEQEIAREVDPVRRANLLFRRAYMFNEQGRFEAALADLDAALALVPRDPRLLHERAYALNELSRYEEAEAALDDQASMQPDEATVYQERAFSRFYQANLEGAFADRDRVVALRPNDGGARAARAGSLLWLGRFNEARRDYAATLTMSADGSAASIEPDEIDLWASPTPGGNAEALCQLDRLEGGSSPPHIIGDCTAWFLNAQTAAEKADALTVRSVAWRLLRQTEGAGMNDLRVAVALDPDNWQRHVNLGQAYLSTRHSWAARLEFNRSLDLQRSWLALAGRSVANFNLDNIDAASADATASLEIQSNVQALIVLGDIAMHYQYDVNAARRHWMSAYRLGSREDGLFARLREAGVTDPEHAPR